MCKEFGSNIKKGTVLSYRESQDVISDEITLRDEILELKKQVMILKRTNQQNLIKFRKYEDEAKRKDRQIEQLMNPRKNSEITKVLSMKGAAILMNLKDQNNSLIQMILTKDMQIRRLVSEIKTSKLYSPSRKMETNRADVIRLRNSRIKTQEILKGNIEFQKKHQRSIYINDNTVLELSPTSIQSSSCEVEELKFTIQSLETHIKYSNELISKKNQEIMNLSAELSELKGIPQCRTCKITSPLGNCECGFQKCSGEKCSLPYPWQNNLKDTLPPSISANTNILEYLEKNVHINDGDRLPNSAPSSLTGCASLDNIMPNNISSETQKERFSENKCKNEISKKEYINSQGDDNRNSHTFLITSRVQEWQSGEAAEVEKNSNKIIRDKWRNALYKFKEQNRRRNDKRNVVNQYEENNRKKFDSLGEGSDIEIYEFERMEKEIRNEEISCLGKSYKSECTGEIIKIDLEDEALNTTFIESEVDLQTQELKNNNSSTITTEEEKEIKEVYCDGRNPVCISSELSSIKENHKMKDKTFENSSKIKSSENRKEADKPVELSKTPEKVMARLDYQNNETQIIKNEIRNIASTFSPDIRRELKNLCNNITAYEELESKVQKRASSLNHNCESYDSSFDSENSYASESQVPQFVEVEVEINPFRQQYVTEKLEKETPKKLHLSQENESDCDVLNDVDDDDDVVVR